MRYGTNHFLGYVWAIRYYKNWGGAESVEDARKMVDAKLKMGEIHLNKPSVKPGQTVTVNTEEGRYFIEE